LDNDIISGSDAQVAVVRRAQAIHALLKDDPRFCYQSRTVSYVGYDDGAVNTTLNLVRLQGYSSIQFVPRKFGDHIKSEFNAAGLSPVQWEQYWGRAAETDDTTIHAICAVSLAQGVLPCPGSAMRQQGPRGVYYYMTDQNGAVAAVGGGFMSYHPKGPRHDEAFWGMLATDPAWRGKRLACWIGAATVLTLNARFGAQGFSSGVKADNPSSQAMCARLGITQSDFIYAGASDPVLMGPATVTR
jgi:RimJ/RimL family protein N-acetyltransferase